MSGRRLEHGVAGAVLVWLGLAHLWVAAEAPLVRYGYRGAEYLEHIQRQYALELTAGQGWWERLGRLPETLGLLDGQYPALLHVMAAAWGQLAGDGLEATLHLNLLFLAVLAFGTGWTAHRLAGWEVGDRSGAVGDRSGAAGDRSGAAGDRSRAVCPEIRVGKFPLPPAGEGARRAGEGGLRCKVSDYGTLTRRFAPPSPASAGEANTRFRTRSSGAVGERSADEASRGSSTNAALLAAVVVLMMPAVFATARRYYYDLPLAAWCSLATAGLLSAHRSGRSALLAGVATAAACLTKWQALLYLAPGWVWALSAASGLIGGRHAGTLAGRRIEEGEATPGEATPGEAAPGGAASGKATQGEATPGEGRARGEAAGPSRTPGRFPRGAALARLGAAGLLTVLLCWPVACRSDLLGEWASRFSPSIAGWLHLSIQHRHGSLDDALGQGARALAGSGGVLERLGFYLRAFVASSVGPWLTGALGMAVLLGRRWRSLACAMWLTLPPILVLAVAVRVADERFLLPVLPVLAASAAVGWAGIRSRRRARALWLLILGLGLMQMLAVDDLLPGGLGPRSPVQMRGWNRRHEAALSPWQSYLTLAEAACPAGHRPAKIRLTGEMGGADGDLHAWRWALLRACPGIETVIGTPEDSSLQECQAYLSTSRLVDPGRLEVLSALIPGGHPEQVWLYRQGSCP